MSDLEVGLLFVVVLLSVVVIALVRAHNVTSRRLDLIERRMLRAQRRTEAAAHPLTDGDTMTTPASSSTSSSGDDLVDLRGVTVDGEPTEYPLETLDGPTLVAFLSTSCGICLRLWEKLRDEGLDGVPAVVVTKDPRVEELEVARDLAHGGLPVIMSSEAWDDYEVPGSPYFLMVGGDPGIILVEGGAASWDEVRNLARQSSPPARL